MIFALTPRNIYFPLPTIGWDKFTDTSQTSMEIPWCNGQKLISLINKENNMFWAHEALMYGIYHCEYVYTIGMYKITESVELVNINF